MASRLAQADPERQVSTLLYCMGETTEETLNATKISTEHRKDFNKVIDEFDKFFNVRKNTIFERAHFNRRTQGENELVEHFMEIPKTGKMDRPTAIEQIQHSGTKSTSQCKSVRSEIPRAFTQQTQGASSNSRCTRCGKGSHSKMTCPARNAVCHNCKKQGHYQIQYFSKTIGEVSMPPSMPEIQEEAYLNTVNSSTDGNTWSCIVKVDETPPSFKLDIGAEVTLVTEATAKHQNSAEKLQKSVM